MGSNAHSQQGEIPVAGVSFAWVERALTLGQWVFRGQRTAETWGVAGTRKGQPRDPQPSNYTLGELPPDLVGNSYRGCLWIRKQFLGELVKS